ncbi:hypothetical protein BH24DEI2_BH24DEI2_09680 [soil metagenome]
MTAALQTALPEPSDPSPCFVEGFLSALADRVVILDRDGRVTCVSEAATLDLPPTLAASAPTLAASAPTLAAPTLLRPGVSYPDLCRRAEAAGFVPAGTAAAGVTALLQGKRPDLRLELTVAGRVLELQASSLQTGGGAVVVHRDITLAAARLREMRKLAYSDALTGLNNRQ